MIDFRSDTVTRPTTAMMDAMRSAPVGDDVFGDDPTVNRLESMAAERFGMEAALFCPSGTMTNQIAINVHTSPGDEVICDRLSHVYNYEGGGIARTSGASVRLLSGDRGCFTAADVTSNINPDDPHFPITRLVVAENTSNKGGGAVFPFADLEAIATVCRREKLAFHLDGARLFNALIESDQTETEYGVIFDSISICLSKGLGCPVGSILIGRSEFIKHARRVRKVLGGGMRQAGFLAAAGMYALENHVVRLTEDHRHAKQLETILADLPFVTKVLPVVTNIIVAEIDPSYGSSDFIINCAAKNVLVTPFGGNRVRFVTHLDISGEDIDQTSEILRRMA